MSPAAAPLKASPEILVVATPDGEAVAIKAPAAKKKPTEKKATAESKATTAKKPAIKKPAATKKPAAKKTAAPKAAAKSKETAAPTAAKAKPAAKPKTAAKAKAPADQSSAQAPASLDAAADALLDAATDTPADLAIAMGEKDDKAAKALASIKIGPKGVYTEDSIRVYLQEIGRIRLLRPDEEIELARKIADLLHLEELAAQFEVDNGHLPDNKEWAGLVEMPLIKFRRRLMLGRRAKERWFSRTCVWSSRSPRNT